MKRKPDLLLILALILGVGVAISSYARSHIDGLEALASYSLEQGEGR